MNRFTLRFSGADAEQAFANEQAAKSVRQVRIACASLCLLALCFYAMTVFVFSGFLVGISRSQAPRYALATLLTFGLGYGLTWWKGFARWHQPTMLLFVGLLFLGIIRMAADYPRDVLESRGFVAMMSCTFLVYSVFGLRFPFATLAGWAGSTLFVAYLHGLDYMGATAAGRSVFSLGLANFAGMLICHGMEVAARKEFTAMRLLDAERERSDRLLLNILPEPIARRLKGSTQAIADHSSDVTVLFADIVGFTQMSARKTPQELVELLNRIFSEFDEMADVNGLEKIKTIGDAYMAVAGLPQPQPDHALRAARMALQMHQAIEQVATETGEHLALRIGLHSGPVVAGVIGRRKFAYDLWGDTVNTASRMESHGLPGHTHCTETTASLLRAAFTVQERGVMDIKGKGEMKTCFLVPTQMPATGPGAIP